MGDGASLTYAGQEVPAAHSSIVTLFKLKLLTVG
jgi:hypothetical protein